MAGQEEYLLMGGNSQPQLTAVGVGVGRGIVPGCPRPHVSVIVMVVLAVVVLYTLDRFGFRFAVTAGRR